MTDQSIFIPENLPLEEKWIQQVYSFPFKSRSASQKTWIVWNDSLGLLPRKWMRFLGFMILLCFIAYFHYLMTAMMDAIHVLRQDHHKHHSSHPPLLTVETDKSFEIVDKETPSVDTQPHSMDPRDEQHLHSPHHSRGDAIHVDIEMDQINTQPPSVESSYSFETRESTIPLCLISTWEKGPLPPFAISMIHSLKQSEGFAKLFLFHHQAGYAAHHLNDHFNSSVVRVVDMGALKESYNKGGITRFAADRVCQIHNVSTTSKTCDKLYYAMRWSNFRGENPPPIVQLRGMFGRIFEQWINPSVCDAWAWTDLDIVFGNIKGFLDQRNAIVWDNHVLTVSGLDWENVYTRGQLTVHIQNNNKSHIVNSIWQYCDAFKSTDALALALAEGNKGFCMDEGCYAKAVVLSGVRFAVFPWQGNVWDLRHSVYAAHVGGAMYITSGCPNRTECRRQVAQDFQHSSTVEMIPRMNKDAQWHRMEWVEQYPQCMWWIVRKYQNCIKSPQLPSLVRTGQAAWGLVVQEGQVNMWTWKIPHEVQGSDELDRPTIRTHWYDFNRVEQVLFFHFTEWKHYFVKGLPEIPTKETDVVQAEVLSKWVKSLSWDTSTGKVFELYNHTSRLVSFSKWSEA